MASRVLLYAMGQKGLAVLDRMVERGPERLLGVVGSRDPQVRDDGYDAIRLRCESAGVPWWERHSKDIPQAEVVFAVSWRWIIEEGSRPLVVFHDSLLPRYRGFNPLVSGLINGDSRLGVTALLGVEDFDRGPILAQAALDVTYPLTIAEAIDRISPLYAELASRILDALAAGRPLTGTPQDESHATYSLWRDEADYRVDWREPAAKIRRMIDAVGHPYRGASAKVNGRLARILSAEMREDVLIENRVPGKVLFREEGQPVVVCGQGLLRITGLVDDESRESLLPLSRYRVRFE